MANFTAKPTVGITLSVETWTDPAVDGLPSRLNSAPAHPPKYYQGIASVGPIEVKATVGGVEAPLDAALAGDLFATSFAEWPPGQPPPAITLTAGQSSLVSFTPLYAGLHLLVMRRTNGGAVGLHFYVSPAE